MLHAKAAIAALLIGTGVLGGGAAAFADTAIPAPSFDHSITVRTDRPVVVVRSSPSGQALNDLGYLDQSKTYPSAAEVTGPPSFDGPQWIPIRYTTGGPIGYVNAVTVVVGPLAAVKVTLPLPTAGAASTPAASPAAPSSTPVAPAPAPLLWWGLVLGLLSAAAGACSVITKRSRLQLVAPLAAAAAAIASSFFVPAGSTPLLLSALVSIAACAAILRAAVRQLNEPLSADRVKRAVAGRIIQYLLAGAVGLPVVVLLAVQAPTAAVVAVTVVCISLAASWALISAGPADEPKFIEEQEVYVPRAWSTNKEKTNG